MMTGMTEAECRVKTNDGMVYDNTSESRCGGHGLALDSMSSAGMEY